VNTGIAFVGSVGTSDGRSDFTAMGDVVNLTARLSSLADVGEILIGERAWAEAAIADEATERRRLTVKGKSDPIDVVALQIRPD
jgi:class 3 adenylate cyclase